MRCSPAVRRLLGLLFGLVWAALASSVLLLHARADDVTIQVDPSQALVRISPDFIGFGYETSAVAQANYFGGSNATLIQLYRNLSKSGLIRVGGCASDNTAYEPDSAAVPRSFRELTVLNRSSLRHLAEFARSTGWKVMWGLNLGRGSREQAAAEADAVEAELGSSLQSFEIGNEVDALPRFHHDYEVYRAAFLEYQAAIRAELPQAPFSGPDSTGNWNWITSFANSEKNDVALITQHYYCADAHDPRATMARMLAPDEHWEERLRNLQRLSATVEVPYRINEVNSFSSGGKTGVSDTFGAALWCLDYMFLAAKYGCNGVNLETDINHLAWISHYSPIVHDPSGTCSARPEYYGMLAFALAGNGTMLRTDYGPGLINLSAYATREDAGSIWLVVINKDPVKDASVQVQIAGRPSAETAQLFRMQAPSVTSRDHVTLGNAEVAGDGTWKPGVPELVTVQAGRMDISVLHGSAALIRLQP